MNVEYLRHLGLRVPPGSSTPLTLRPRSLQSTFVNGNASAAISTNGIASAAISTAPSSGSMNGSKAVVPPTEPEEYCQLCGYVREPVKREGHPAWFVPKDGEDKGLKAFNSLTGEKEAFRPLEGRTVRWYTCGPTVYDVAHMGHARAYLTFDILRRIMVGYFGYDVKYQINITDIDDKIILRSRQNKLFDDFSKEAEGMSAKELQKVVDAAVQAADQKLQAKKPAEADAKSKEDYEKQMAEFDLKAGQLNEMTARVTAAKAGAKDALLVAAREPLMAKLDKERGHTVTDHAIFDKHSRHFENEYFEDMDALKVLRPDTVSRISEYMDGRVQKFIEKLEDNGFAYASAGSVYFDIDRFNSSGYTYRKLVPACFGCSAADMEEGEGALAAKDTEKRNPNDFAVWKKSKPGEPAWESRWGAGRPGWHIECSVMATDVNAEFLDVHAGGEDLKFPHHDNEMAQSEAYLGRKQWVNYFWHAGHLHIEGLKMSKSLKNFITIRQALEFHSARQLRMMFLMQQWDKGMNYSDQAIDMARAEERKMKHLFGCLTFFLRHEHSQAAPGEREEKLSAKVVETREAIGVALRDNFNTSKVVELLSQLVSQCYQSYEALPAACLAPVQEAASLVAEIFGILGVEDFKVARENEAAWTAALDAFAALRDEVRRQKDDKAVAEAVEAAAPAAAAARAAGLTECAAAFEGFLQDCRNGGGSAALLRRCDQVRDKDFIELGARLEDRGTSGFVWMFDDIVQLKRELEEKAAKAAEGAKAKLRNRLKQKNTDLRTAEKASVPPEEMFKNGTNTGLYVEFDEMGVPTKLASGEELSKAKKKDCVKERTKQQKDYDKLLKQSGDAGIQAFIENLRKEVAELEAQLGPE